MTPDDMKRRTKAFAAEVIRFCETLPSTIQGRVVAGQLIRSSCSVGANYRSACRARSRREFVAKIGLVLEEADESLYWLELISDTQLSRTEVLPLLQESSALVAILAKTKLTAQRHLPSGKSSI